MTYPEVLFPRYTQGFNLAESYYMASAGLSWQDVIIGDPKTSIVYASPTPIQLSYFQASQIPRTNNVQFQWGTLSETNNYGFYIQVLRDGNFVDIPGSFTPGHGTTIEPQHYSWVYQNLANGRYAFRLKQIDLDGTINYYPAVEVLVKVKIITPVPVAEKINSKAINLK